jgi:hypothetical protein
VSLDLPLPYLLAGRTHHLRAVCDGDNFGFWVNDVPMFISRITDHFPRAKRLRMRRVGLCLMGLEEHGDQGTILGHFAAWE